MAITFELPGELHQRVKDIAAEQRRSLTQTLVVAVEEYIQRHDHAARVDVLAARITAEDDELLRRLA